MRTSKEEYKIISESFDAIANKQQLDEIKTIDAVHLGLDVAGMIPGIGNLFDLANAGLYASRGKKGMAALSLGAAIPGLGLAAGATKLGTKGAKAAAAAGKVAKAEGKALAATKQGKKIKALYRMARKDRAIRIKHKVPGMAAAGGVMAAKGVAKGAAATGKATAKVAGKVAASGTGKAGAGAIKLLSKTPGAGKIAKGTAVSGAFAGKGAAAAAKGIFQIGKTQPAKITAGFGLKGAYHLGKAATKIGAGGLAKGTRAALDTPAGVRIATGGFRASKASVGRALGMADDSDVQLGIPFTGGRVAGEGQAVIDKLTDTISKSLRKGAESKPAQYELGTLQS
jgi:hypothetical protein